MIHHLQRLLALCIALLGLSVPLAGVSQTTEREYFILKHDLKAGETLYLHKSAFKITNVEGAVYPGGSQPLQALTITEEGAKSQSIKLYTDGRNELKLNSQDAIMGREHITGIDVSHWKTLKILHIVGTRTTSLDISQNPNLVHLFFAASKLKTLRFGNNSQLRILHVEQNELSKIEVIGQSVLNSLHDVRIDNNKLSKQMIQRLIDAMPNNQKEKTIWLTNGKTRENHFSTEQIKQLTSMNWIPYIFTANFPRLKEGNDGQPENNDEEDEQGNEKPASPDIFSFTTDRNIGDTIYLGFWTTPENDLTFEGVEQLQRVKPNKHTPWGVTIHAYRVTSKNITFKSQSFGTIYADYVGMTNIDVSKIKKGLHTLFCNHNKLTTIDVSNLPKLISFHCDGNRISNLKLPTSPKSWLKILSCEYNNLTSLDLSQYKKLVELNIQNNKISSLNIEGLSNLESILAINNKLTTIDVREYPKLKRLEIRDNQISSLDISQNPELYHLLADKNKLTSIDVSHNPKLKVLDVSDNEIYNLNISACPLLEEVVAMTCQLRSIDVSQQPNLKKLVVVDNHIKQLDLSNNPRLERLNVTFNQLEQLDIKNNPAIRIIYCDRNYLNKAAMWTLVNGLPQHKGQLIVKYEPDFNEITEDQVAVATRKGWLVTDNRNRPYAGVADNTQYNSISFTTQKPVGQTFSIGVKPNLVTRVEGATLVNSEQNGDYTYLTYRINTPNINMRGAFEEFNIVGENISKIDVSQAPTLTQLRCHYNQLQQLDVSQNTKLTHLICSNNNLSALDLSHNTQLIVLTTAGNKIRGQQMTQLLQSLPTVSDGQWVAIDLRGDLSTLTASQVAEATKKGWKVIYNNGQPYAGSDQPVQGVSNDVTSFTTTKRVGDTILMNFSSNSNIKMEGATFVGSETTDRGTRFRYRLTQPTVNIYGAIDYFDCPDNEIAHIDVSRNTVLTELYADNNKISAIDLSRNEQLQYCTLDHNQLSLIDVRQNAALRSLYCGHNRLTQILLGNNSSLARLFCANNAIRLTEMTTLVNALPNIDYGYFEVFDRENPNEENFITPALVQQAKDKGWNVHTSNGDSYEGNTSSPDQQQSFITLATNKYVGEEIEVYVEFDGQGASVQGASFQGRVVRDGKSFVRLKLTDQNVTLFGTFTTFVCNNNQLTSLSVFKCPTLQELSCSGNALSLLDVSRNAALRHLDVSYNNISSIDVSRNSLLQQLNVAECNIAQLDLSHNPALRQLSCYGNVIGSANMDRLINSLPTVSNGSLVATKATSDNEHNVISKDQAQRAERKGWRTIDLDGNPVGISATINNAAPLEMYDLSGRRVSSSRARGITILRQGGRTTKVVR